MGLGSSPRSRPQENEGWLGVREPCPSPPPPLLSPQHLAHVSQKILNTVGRPAASLSPLKMGQPMFPHLGSPSAGSGAGLEWESSDVCGKTEGRADGKQEGSGEERMGGKRSTRHHSRQLWLPGPSPGLLSRLQDLLRISPFRFPEPGLSSYPTSLPSFVPLKKKKIFKNFSISLYPMVFTFR